MPVIVRNLLALLGIAALIAGGTVWFLFSQSQGGFYARSTSSHTEPPASGEVAKQAPAPVPQTEKALEANPLAPADLDAGAPAAPTSSAQSAQAPPPVSQAAPSVQPPDASANTVPGSGFPGASSGPAPAEPTAGEASPDVWPQGTTPVKFAPLRQAFSVARDTMAYWAPGQGAPAIYRLPLGTPIYSVEKSGDGQWVVALTTDGKAAYLPAADLGPFDPLHPAPVILIPTITGNARVIDTATLAINGQTIPLSGIVGVGGTESRDLQRMISSKGGFVTCALREEAYLCKLPDGSDIARSALFNGAAKASENASDDYRAQLSAAEAAHRGIWR